MLQALRNGVKSPIMKVFLIFLAGGFALWGVGDITTGLIGGSDKAISAGDESLSPREVAVEFDRTRRNYLPNATMGEALQSGLLGEVAGSLARDVVFKAEANSLGLTVTRAMQRAEVAREPSFKDANDEFSQTRFIGVLAGAGLSEAEYLERVSIALRREQIVDALAAGAAQPASVARTLTSFELERRTARIVSFPVEADSITTPTDDQLASWFEEVKSRYDAPALRSARVGSIEPQMFADGIDISDSAIETAYADRLVEFTTPESRRVRQMVFDDMETAQTALSRVSGGEEFAAVASDMLGWSEDDITLGLVTRNDLEGAVGDAVFDAGAGAVAGPAESVFGVHLLVVDEIIEGGETSLDEVREEIRTTLRLEAATDLIYDKVNELEDKIASGATLDEAFASINGTVVTLTDVDRRGADINGQPVAGDASEIGQDSLVLEAVWAADIDEIGVVEEGTDDMFFVVEVTGESDPRERSLDEVRSRAVVDWQTVEAIKSARAAAESAIEAGSIFDSAETTTDFRRNGIGLDHEAARLIATAVFEQDSGDARVVETGTEAIAVRTETIMPADADELDRSATLVGDVIANSIRQDVLNTLAGELSQTHDLRVQLGSVQQLLIGTQ